MSAIGGQTNSMVPPFGRNVSGGAPCLLVIDDAKVHRMIICRIAEKSGLNFIEADSCTEVIKALSETSYCGATLDLSLGERAGTEVIMELARFDFRPPVIIISGSDLQTATDAQQMGLALGLDMHEPVPKPLDLAKLRRRFISIREASRAGSLP